MQFFQYNPKFSVGICTNVPLLKPNLEYCRRLWRCDLIARLLVACAFQEETELLYVLRDVLFALVLRIVVELAVPVAKTVFENEGLM